ncbi:MAG: hypothetical protein EA377_09805 [Phycisphaerales bacterium]|nr:MAG: hypothetical protein EA377_09805 [Phycisphaerales bacterium]
MTQRRFHYEQAFEHYIRANRVPYVAVDEAKKSLLPEGSPTAALKSFDFVVYGAGRNLLVDVKGRMFGSANATSSVSNRRFESWVTRDDVEGLSRWQTLFGPEFEAVLVFAYCLRQQPPDALFEEVFSFGRRWYVLREVTLEDYRKHMVDRSAKWDTVHLPAERYREVARPFTIRRPASESHPPSCGRS